MLAMITMCKQIDYHNVTSRNKRYHMSIFEQYGIFALSNGELNKLSNDTRIIKIEVLLLKIWEKDGLSFLLFSLFFTT